VQTIFDDMLHQTMECYVGHLVVKSKGDWTACKTFVKFSTD